MSGKTIFEEPLVPANEDELFSEDERHRKPARVRPPKYTLITGGAGFVGTNLAHRLLSAGDHVLIYDNLSRKGSEQNLLWLRKTHRHNLEVEISDIRDQKRVQKAVQNAKQVFHLAAQVAVTSSLLDPVSDFECNLRGTLNLLEALRALQAPCPLVFTSTNKVYGPLDDIQLKRTGRRYEPGDDRIRQAGIGEDRTIMFHSPYGCSKGAADQYVADYARVFGLTATVFRMSCIYGPHQFGTEDQGWVANFLIRAIEHRPITVFGDGLQVRDVLFVDDLIDAFVLAQAGMDSISGEIFNIGGGSQNTLSLVELLDFIRELVPDPPEVCSDDWRTGDQRYYVSDHAKFSRATGWRPKIGVREGVEVLYDWLARSGNFQVRYARRHR